MDRILAAFIAGLLLGLMIIRRVKMRVVELEVQSERQGRGSDGQSDTRPEPQNLRAFPATG